MASFQTFRLVPVRDEAPNEKDEWAGLSDARERRKRQNRLNQRAARRRHRLNEGREAELGTNNETQCSAVSANRPKRTRSQQTGACLTTVHFPLTRDAQLLHVISVNVSRAILTNYFIVTSIPLSTYRFCSIRRVFVLPPPEETPSPTSETSLPPCLMPTQIQEQVPHQGWIDLFPSPQLRDNLILALEHSDIDEEAFMVDLVGESLESLCFTGGDENEAATEAGPEAANPDGAGAKSAEAAAGEGIANASDAPSSWIGESGIVSWSDPWDVSGWEVTELFAKKWGFLLHGCRDVVAAANTWREYRGEDPLAVTI